MTDLLIFAAKVGLVSFAISCVLTMLTLGIRGVIVQYYKSKGEFFSEITTEEEEEGEEDSVVKEFSRGRTVN